MFDTLTEDERTALYFKLHAWAHNLYDVAHTLARASLAASDYKSTAWDHRERYIAARSEILDLITELAA